MHIYIIYVYAYIWNSVNGYEKIETNQSVFGPLNSGKEPTSLSGEKIVFPMELVQLRKTTKAMESQMTS